MNFVLPWPPSVNTYYRAIARGKFARQILSKKAREYKAEVVGVVGDVEAIAGRLMVTIELHAPTRRKYDIDNRVKAVLDSLQNAGVFEDDEQIDTLTVRRCHVKPRDGKALVEVTSLGWK